jgi:SSS family solute:Na+ symporter
VFTLETTETRLWGQGSGVWGLLVSVALFVGVSLVTRAPVERAALFIDTTRKELKEKAAV